MKLLLTILMATTLFTAGCNNPFTAAERKIIGNGNEMMRVTTIDNEADSTLLRRTSRPLRKKDVLSEEFTTLCRRMLATVQNPENEGVGIAAPQVGILRRVVAVQRFDKEGEPFEFYVNPEIVEFGDEMELGGEGCLSVPDFSGDVWRAQRIVIKYRDENFSEQTEVIEGFTAVIFQHEIDHLDGILYIDRMEEDDQEEEYEK